MDYQSRILIQLQVLIVSEEKWQPLNLIKTP